MGELRGEIDENFYPECISVIRPLIQYLYAARLDIDTSRLEHGKTLFWNRFRYTTTLLDIAGGMMWILSNNPPLSLPKFHYDYTDYNHAAATAVAMLVADHNKFTTLHDRGRLKDWISGLSDKLDRCRDWSDCVALIRNHYLNREA